MRTASIDDLPDALLGRILALCGRQAWRSVTLVAKRWHGAFYSEPSLWHSLTIRRPKSLRALVSSSAAQREEEHWWQAMVQLTRRAGPWVQTALLDCGDCADRQWDVLLGQLPPAMLSSLRLNYCVRAPALALRRLSALTDLRLHFDGQLGGGANAVLGMHQLRRLSISALQLPVWLIRGAAGLTQLTSLRLDAEAYYQPFVGEMLSLQRLSQLRCLELLLPRSYEHGRNALLVPRPACFPHLRRHDLHNCDVEGLERGLFSQSTLDASPAGPDAELELQGLTDGSQLPQLLDTLLPPGWQLASLTLRDCKVEAAVPCHRLSTLTRLRLVGCTCDGAASDVPRLARRAPNLRSLCLSYLEPDVDNEWLDLAGITHLAQLTHLELHSLPLLDIPAGPYLAGIQELQLEHNWFTSLPRALVSATNLTHLDLRESYEMALSEDDVSQVLAHMPRLACLLLGEHNGIASGVELPRQQPHVLDLLRQHLPNLCISVHPGAASDSDSE